MAIKGLESIIQQREEQYNQAFGKEKNDAQEFELLKEAISTLADNQKKIYQKLEEIELKIKG
ncbi:MAG: hypothetical protein ACOC3V_04575 [bacterium]